MIYVTYCSGTVVYETAVIDKIVNYGNDMIGLFGRSTNITFHVTDGMSNVICVDVNKHVFNGRTISFILGGKDLGLTIQSNGEMLYNSIFYN